MIQNTSIKKSQNANYHLTVDGDVITVTIRGVMSGTLVRALSEEITRTAASIRIQNGNPVVLLDASAVRFSEVIGSGRAEGRRMLRDVPVVRWAFLGTAHVGMLAEYIGRAAGVSHKMRYFSNKRAALTWIRGKADTKHNRSSVGLIVGITLAVIGTVSLIGWQTGNQYFTSILPSLRPINPVAAGGLIALGVAFFCYWLGALKPLRILGWVGIGLGIAALLPLSIDTILYKDAVIAAGNHTQLADSAAVCFILSGLLGLLANRNGKWVQPVEYTLAGIMGSIALFNIYGQLYATSFIYSISDSFVMALNLAIAFLITSLGMIVLVMLRRTRSILQRVTRSGWLIVIALVLVQVATYASWVQAADRNANDSKTAFTTKARDINEQVNSRLQAYVSALHGFRGLFAASSNVNQGDFEAYYSSLNLTQSYPGLRTIAFIAAVKTNDLSAFAAARKADDSLDAAAASTFKLQKITNEPLHFIASYSANAQSITGLGTDVTSIPGRSEIYNKALRSDNYYSSGSITFPKSATQPATRGFFIATPVTTADSTAPIGVVSANFNYKDFFAAVLNTINDKNISLAVIDTATNETIYASGEKLSSANLLSQEFTTSIAQNQSWRVNVKAPENFGATTNQARLANSIVFFGHLFTILLASIFIIQIRARGQALALADAITEDLQVERDNIAALHKKDEAILSGIGEGLVVIDQSGRIEMTNTAATEMLGYERNEMIGKDLPKALQAMDEKGQPMSDDKRPFKQALRQLKTVTARLNYIHKDGRPIPVRITIAPLILRDELIGAIEVFSDITKEKQLEHMKDEFLSVASHELRTPMGAIRANLAMILDGDYGKVNKNLVEPLTDMKDSTIRLVELVSDLLNVARIEAGRVHFELKEVDIAETTRSVVGTLAPLGKEKGVQISLAKHKNLKLIQADTDKVKQVLTNLIGNSLKFTAKGSITVTLEQQEHLLEITVTDTGIGISPEDQKKLFGKFNQITSAQAGKPAGTGLGLYISREIIRKMGGEMWIKESKPGKGSTFAFTLPYAGTSQAKKVSQFVKREAEMHPDQV